MESALGFAAWAVMAWKVCNKTIDRDVVDNKARLRLALVKSVTHKKTKEAIMPLEEPKDVIYKITEMLGTAPKLMEEINRLVDAMTTPRYHNERVNNILDISSYVGVIKKTKKIQIWEEAT